MTQYVVFDTRKNICVGPYRSKYDANIAAGKTGYSGDQGMSSLHLIVIPVVEPWEYSQEALEAKLDGEVFL